MAQFEWVHAAWLALAIVLEIVANVFLKFSDGFRRKIFGLLSLAAVLAAFSALSQAVKGIDLPFAFTSRVTRLIGTPARTSSLKVPL